MDDQTQPSPEKNSDKTVEIELSSTVLDLTSFQLHDLASVELSPTLTELDLTANRLSSLDPRISHLSNLTKLSFRQNLINDAAFEPISRLVSRGWSVACIGELTVDDDRETERSVATNSGETAAGDGTSGRGAAAEEENGGAAAC
ncbi:hypothetical protein LWI29_003849 [Acer saccharum]|uniref:Uncharacterized protein n=1 Tax=Acer saccharum TaxID=4024 RepID=A0AA39T9A5_ACESA|nr:hypothetical protein LWI29_003849 [Acer saccharum]